MIIEDTNISLGFGSNTGETFLETYDIGIYSGQPLPMVFCSISGINPFKRIKSAHLYLKLFNSSLNNNETVGLGYYADTDEEIADTIDNNFLRFDVTHLIKEHLTVLNPNGTQNTSGSFIDNINPYRYKSYYFDTESGYYYCQARYYYPLIRRWLSMDEVSYLNSSSLFGLNLYAYCNDNPVMFRDEKGHVAAWIIGLITGIIVGAISGVTTAMIEDYSDNKSVDFSISGNRIALTILSSVVLGAALGVAGGIGSATLGPVLAGTSQITIGNLFLKLGIALSVSSLGGMGSYSINHFDNWKTSSFIKAASLTPIQGLLAFGVGGVTGSMLATNNHVLQYIVEQFVGDIFENPISKLLDYLFELAYE